MTRPQIVGLFEGYGGLTRAVQAATGGEFVAYSEIEPAACRLLEHHHPGVPNLGDIAQIDWTAVPRVDVLTGGFPCQDVSSAGRRAGIRPGTRSGLWTHMAYAIDQLRPGLVVIENVRGLLSADAACDVEPCPWCLGDDEGRPLRALGAVLGDLADLGYDARWVGLRAADVGAPHGRYRIFITAWPAGADTARFGCGPAGWDHGVRAEGLVEGVAADTGSGELHRRGVGGVLAGPQGAGDGEGPERERDRHTARNGREDAADSDSVRPARAGAARERRTGFADHNLAAADTVREGRGAGQRLHGAGGPAAVGDDSPVAAWGDYEPAIRRWELILDRPAPAPTQTGKRGGQQLSPLFVEWMQGLPEGWVTGVPGISRNEQLKLLGNGVVPQQAEAALRYLLVPSEAQVAA